MYILCIFPTITNEENIPKIIKCFKDKIAPKLNRLGAEKVDLKFPPPDYTFVGTAQSLKPDSPKGKGIKEVLKNVPFSPDYVLVCDGSGKIPYTSLVDVFRELVSDSSVNCVMVERVGKNKAISQLRFLIERWEVFLLKKFMKHPQNIPDGQCGLWGVLCKRDYYKQ